MNACVTECFKSCSADGLPGCPTLNTHTPRWERKNKDQTPGSMKTNVSGIDPEDIHPTCEVALLLSLLFMFH